MGNLCSVTISADNTISRCQDFTVGHANYLCKLEDKRESLRTAFKKLKELRHDVHRKVESLETSQLTPCDQVMGWLSGVDEMEVDVNNLLSDSPPENQCLGAFCSRNCWSSYKLGKKVAKMLAQVEDLKSSGHFKELVGPIRRPLVEERPIEPTKGLESMFSQVWNCLSDEKNGIIGLYGMGGVGKTTLLTKVNNEFKNSPSGFDVVIMVDLEVSEKLDVGKIQDNIAERIGFSDDTWKNNARDKKARDIYGVLNRKRFVLLLDNLWETVDLTKIGVPHPDNRSKSKIAFTTRSEKVCGQMKAHKIKIECLAWETAWELFQDTVGKEILELHSQIPELAKCVAKECGGLPLALVTIGGKMSSTKTPDQWKLAIERLRKSASDFEGMGDKVLPVLQISYDNLPNNIVRSCFLYCTLFPEDFLIEKDALIDFWIGEGFLDEDDSISGIRNKGYDIMGTLLNECLLEDEGNSVKLHDVIRDMALWIGSGCGRKEDKFLVQAGVELITPPEAEKWKRAERISLMSNCLENLIEPPPCSSLLTLFLHKNLLRKISDDFFQYFPVLRVLDLSYNEELSELPVGISKLTSLQYLNVSYTGITQLPTELRMLEKMKYLNLSGTHQLQAIPPLVISSFSELQVCKLRCCGSVSPAIDDNVLFDGSASLLEELTCLEHLKDLDISIKSLRALKIFLSSHKLQSCTRELSVEFSRDQGILNGILNLSSSQNLKSLCIDGFGSLEVVTIDWESVRRQMEIPSSVIITQNCFHNLSEVRIQYCSQLRDLTWIIFAPNIRNILLLACNEIQDLISIEKLGKAPEVAANRKPFDRLEYLSLRHLPRLKRIYSNGLPFISPKNMEVVDCPELEMPSLNPDRGEEDWWNQLEWENDATRNAVLAVLRWFEVSG